VHPSHSFNSKNKLFYMLHIRDLALFYYYLMYYFVYFQLPSKTQLLKMIKEAGGLDGDLMVLGIPNIKRAKRLMGLELVRNNNMVSANSK
jgi:hypothetical protein